MSVNLITSAAYVATELVAEYGKLPPAFLPVGHERLYALQAAVLGSGAYLTLPESFSLPEADSRALADAGLRIVTVPDGLPLGLSVLYALEIIGDTPGPIRILHGDTLIE